MSGELPYEDRVNATRCGFSARQHPNYQGYVWGGDAQPSDCVAKGFIKTLNPVRYRWLIPPPDKAFADRVSFVTTASRNVVATPAHLAEPR
jgi:hypothetical protein